MGPGHWQIILPAVLFLVALGGLYAIRRPSGKRRRGKIPVSGRSVHSIRRRIFRERSQQRSLTAPTVYLPTNGTLPQQQSPLTGLTFHPPDVQLMQRVLDSLRRLPEQRQAPEINNDAERCSTPVPASGAD
ncbi:hypothetical protein [Actinocrispum sp. NPDC049592]|uniref:hypothetical protein n=1 Tax=Actinocrispum sp. NPDC049592 TaxID=3154835 RepID=UPI00341D7434